MDAAMDPKVSSDPRLHKRSTSSVVKSIIPKKHQRKATAPTICPDWNEDFRMARDDGYTYNLGLPLDHPHARQHLREDSGNRNQRLASPKKSSDMRKANYEASSENENMKWALPSNSPMKETTKSPRKKTGKEEKAMKKSKSSTSLSALLSRPKSSKGIKDEITRPKSNKENQAPPPTVDKAPPPIWAQFATQDLPNAPRTTKIALNDRKSIDEEIRRYTPAQYSPSKQRNFQNDQNPSLYCRPGAKQRPKSECLVPQPTRESFAETVSRLQKSGLDRRPPHVLMSEQWETAQTEFDRQGQARADLSGQRLSVEQRETSYDAAEGNVQTGKRGSRVMAAVAAFGGNSKELPKEPSESTATAKLDPQVVETAFESLLDARNVPQNTRDKMRSLDTKIKADFISKNTGSASSIESLTQQPSRPGTGKLSNVDDASALNAGVQEKLNEAEESTKKSRPRSRTFTFSKGDQSPSKKQKADRPKSHQRNKSGCLTPSESSKSLTPSGSTQGLSLFNRGNKPATPEEHLGYLRKVQQPEKVEVGRIHKLRQLLRNESVGWVDEFINEGGMKELVELLYRIMNVEWRVEHEDVLLHETLLCLKALSTTSSALHQLSSIQSTLFPTLLAMLFDKEKKGPAEFTTRGIIITLLSTYLTHSPSLDLPRRARLLMSYLRDHSGPEGPQAPEFITSIYHPRPYRIWHKELDSVCKEVFWIFLHHANIIPYPDIPDTSATYISRHFPRDHTPVPAAPYIGSVEWEATNYLTAHLDLINGLIASLPTRDERNAFRQELKDSGFEKVMGVSLRTCKEKFYGCVHEALSVWIGAAKEDGWAFQDVRQGPPPASPKKNQGGGGQVGSPVKGGSPKKREQPPMLEMPAFGFGGGEEGDEGGWL
ncbi:hypothetical protein ACLMJK_005472 [Lecanora helva]